MDYLTGMASSPVYEFPYSGYQAHSIPFFNNDINLLLSNITPPLGDLSYNQHPTITLQCAPQIDSGIGNNTLVFQVSENIPIETILQQFGIDSSTIQRSNFLTNQYRSLSEPMELIIPPSSHRHRQLVCREVSDSEDDSFYRRPSRHHHLHQSTFAPNQSQQSPVARHNLLDRVWHKAERASEQLPSSFSTPNLNPQWQSMRNSPPPPPNVSANNAWQAMRNVPPPISPEHRNAIDKVWHKADYASELNVNRPPNMFNRMQQPTGGIIQPPPQQNREAVHDFLAARNIPYGGNQPNLPAPSSWNRPNYSATNAPPPMINIPWNQMPPSPNPPNPYPPIGVPQQSPGSVPAPRSFAQLLAQAHRQRLPYSGAA